MAVFSTDMAKKYPVSSEVSSGIGRKSFSFQLLPITPHIKMKKSKSLSSTQMSEIKQELEVDSDIAMLSDHFSSSSDEDTDSGTVNASFSSEINGCVFIPFKSFSSHQSFEENLQDGSDVHYLENGKCVVADLLSGCLRIFSKSGKIIVTLGNSETVEPWGLAVYENIVLVTCRRTKCISKIVQTGETEEAPFGRNFFKDPCGIAVTKDHNIIVGDIHEKRVTVHDWNGKLLSELFVPDSFSLPRYIAVSPIGDIIVSDSGNHCIFLFSEIGTFKKCFGSYGSADHQFKSPYGICCDSSGNIFVADHYNDRVSFYSKDGNFIRHVITKHDGIFHPQGISLSSDMKLYVTHGSLKANQVKVFNLIIEHNFQENENKNLTE